jgi:peptidoglycan/LPS O-acetylase OafA/YrhL
MRGICALIVVLLHCDVVLSTKALFRHGWLSVDVFFVMSGFVIALAYEDRLQGVGGFGAFIRARATRLLPVQIIGTLVGALSCLVLYWSGHRIVPGLSADALLVALVYGLFLVPISLSPVAGIFSSWQWGFPINPPLWSLHGEWVVNIIYGRFFFAAKTWVLAAIYGVSRSICCINFCRAARSGI